MLMPHHKNAGENYNIKTANKPFKNFAKFKYLEAKATNQRYIHADSSNMLPFSSESFVILFPV
jgi:hypothetical protein